MAKYVRWSSWRVSSSTTSLWLGLAASVAVQHTVHAKKIWGA